MSENVVAIDGPAASGKSTIANLVSERLAIPYINTGNMYRAITLYFLDKNHKIFRLYKKENEISHFF